MNENFLRGKRWIWMCVYARVYVWGDIVLLADGILRKYSSDKRILHLSTNSLLPHSPSTHTSISTQGSTLRHLRNHLTSPSLPPPSSCSLILWPSSESTNLFNVCVCVVQEPWLSESAHLAPSPPPPQVARPQSFKPFFTKNVILQTK